jgi:hypothetical protein
MIFSEKRAGYAGELIPGLKKAEDEAKNATETRKE